MKTFIYILIGIALGLLVYNATLLDFSNLFQGNSSTALIGILASLCVIALLSILLISKKIAENPVVAKSETDKKN